MRIQRNIVAALIASIAATGTASAAELTGTLKKIKDSGAMTLGHRESSIPFSYLDDKQKVVGYSQDVANEIIAAVKKELKMPGLIVKLNSVTSQTRIPLVQNGTVDLECGSTTNNTERQKQVAFSDSIFVIGTRLLTKKTSGVKDFPDLAGKTVVTSAGTTSERIIRKMNADKNMGMNVVSAKDHGESFLMLETGRAVAFMMDDALLYGEMAKARNPSEWAVVGKPQSFEAYGCMMRKDDPQFKALVDSTIAGLMKSGKINDIYKRWFMSPIPPKGLNLSFPMSDDMMALIKNPNDKAYE